MKDPIVEEVRRARENIARKCGYSIPRMAARQRALYQAYQESLVVAVEPIRAGKKTAVLRVADSPGEYNVRPKRRK